MDCNPADHPSRGKQIPPPKPAVLPDPLLGHQLLKGAQSFRPVSVQKMLEQETQRTENEAVVSALVGEDIIPSETSANSTAFQPAVEPACEFISVKSLLDKPD